MWSAVAFVVLGTLFIPIAILGILAAFLVFYVHTDIKYKPERVGATRFLVFISCVFGVVFSVFVFMGGLAIIDIGVKKMDSFREAKR